MGSFVREDTVVNYLNCESRGSRIKIHRNTASNIPTIYANYMNTTTKKRLFVIQSCFDR